MLERKGLGIRIAAVAIDAVILIVVFVALSPIALMSPVLATLLMLIAGLAYPVIEVMLARSPGKMALGLTIVDESGAPATRDQLIKRTVIKNAPLILRVIVAFVAALFASIWLLSLIVSIVGGLAILAVSIGLIVLSWKPLQAVKQCFWDLQAKTAVVGAPAPAGVTPVMPGQSPPPVMSAVPPATPPQV